MVRAPAFPGERRLPAGEWGIGADGWQIRMWDVVCGMSPVRGDAIRFEEGTLGLHMKRLTISAVGGRPDHGFDEPLGLLSDCHRRIEHFLNVLLVIARQLRGGSLDKATRQALEQALHYFATAAPRHTADEEESLFPRLRASADSRVADALKTLDTLESDHREAERLHASVDRLARQWIAADSLSPDDAATLVSHLERLSAAYARHIYIEDRELFPAAGCILPDSEIEQVGREMAERRGVPFRPPEILRGR